MVQVKYIYSILYHNLSFTLEYETDLQFKIQYNFMLKYGSDCKRVLIAAFRSFNIQVL